MFSKVLIANRGEIAVRVARTCRELGVVPVAVYSDVDARARHVAVAGEAVHLPGVAPADTYLNIPALLDAAASTGAEAVHPGYGFLAENEEFARAVVGAGLSWIGPPPDALALAGDKVAARKTALAAGVPIVPGVTEPIDDIALVTAFGNEHGYPIAIKAAGGGGGRGLKVAHAPDQVADAFDSARREARAYFGSEDVYVERYLEAPKHLEVQVLAPGPDHALWLGVRDCSLQRRHQKLIEETPPPRHAGLAAAMGESAVAFAKACGYVNAGTAEFLVDREGSFYFLELNARLQVEHTVTEEVFGVDLVACQLIIAAGEALGFGQDDLQERGCAIECRINAEDPARGFIPTPGPIDVYVEPGGPGVRVDSGYGPGDEIPSAYDSLVAKLIASGATREEARRRMLRALDEFEITGPSTTIAAHELLLTEPSFVAGEHTTRTVEDSGVLDALMQEESRQDVLLIGGRAVRLWNPAMASSAAAAVHSTPGAGGDVVAPMQGTILKVLVDEGQDVDSGTPLMVLEAMKMETTITSAATGRVTEVRASPGDSVASGQVLAVVTASA